MLKSLCKGPAWPHTPKPEHGDRMHLESVPKCIHEGCNEAVVRAQTAVKAQCGPMLPNPSAREQMHLESVPKRVRQVGDEAVCACPKPSHETSSCQRSYECQTSRSNLADQLLLFPQPLDGLMNLSRCSPDVRHCFANIFQQELRSMFVAPQSQEWMRRLFCQTACSCLHVLGVVTAYRSYRTDFHPRTKKV